MDTGLAAYSMLLEFGIVFEWKLSEATARLWDAYAFLGFRPLHTVRGVFVEPKARGITLVRRSKNCLRGLWSNALGLVRPQHPPGSGSVQRRHPHLSGVRGAARAVPQLWPSEARASGLPGRQSFFVPSVLLSMWGGAA